MNSLIDLNNLSFNDKKITVIIDDKNIPWFYGNEIADLLGYSNTNRSINQHVKEKYVKNYKQIHPYQNGMGKMIKETTKFINEFGLYELIMKSKLSIAEKFQDWVFEEVLPSIRKHGEYILNKQLQEVTENFNKQLQLKDEQLQAISASNKCLKNFVDNVKTKNKTGYIYIATSNKYMLLNTFKVGKTDNPKTRLASYNTNRTTNDRFFYVFIEKVYNPYKIEGIINDILQDFKDKKNKEIIILFYDYLSEFVQLVIKNINEPYEYINKLIRYKLSTMHELKPRILPEINIDNLEIEELKSKIIKLLDECIENNNLSMTRKELIDRLDLTESNRIYLWNNIKSLLNWVNSKTPVVYKNYEFAITY